MAADVKESLISPRRIRMAKLLSGLVIFAFLITHLANHAVGLVSVRAADDMRRFFLFVWRTGPGTVLLYGSFLLHVILALAAIYRRRSFLMPRAEAAQIVFGLLVPFFVVDHVISTRIASELFRLHDNYENIVHMMWTKSPVDGLRQSVGILVLWLHGVIGIHFWLRYRAWYQSAVPWLLTAAILLPVLALLGFIEMGRTIASPIFLLSGYPGGYYDPTSLSAAAMSTLRSISLGTYSAFGLSLAAVLLLRVLRWLKERAHLVAIRYPNGETISVPRGYTVLEASRLAGKPHYSACGGKGRCSTCRVQVIEGEENLPPPEVLEQRTLGRINAGPGVRLACQLRPKANVMLSPILVAVPEPEQQGGNYEAIPGRERDIAVLFCDLRNFTYLTETRLPFDIVFLLNRYFAVVGRAVEEAGGRMDKFIGDGAMALFGVSGTAEDGCRQALQAAARIVEGIDELNRQLENELSTPLRIAIGIHTGAAVVGTLGYGTVQTLTAIGDTVNVASRLESVAKDHDVPLVISEPVASLAGLALEGQQSREVPLRGRLLPLKVFVFDKVLLRRLVPLSALS
ncbi:adenylate/guanylate cyclase domain-containing protein [Rhizobium straminoryzae]|uniref:2Fe-2S iron-sulfur cluster binding domain-containing protein n=1 Tax=Rhizobium straminoryzae TaxID=1387186 RepID=A0A549TEW7_9HYPH|nr:adenylate/guanylate cyclase domain-containing protein [Rhizobium straminoryzae]TRL40830.1 2Fe-2S iron-sulfur cluster binding domain-containing protein [Rhizobium straminoryzae]